MVDVPKVTLGGREFAVPEFVVKEQRKFVPLMMECGRVNIMAAGETELGLIYDLLYAAIGRARCYPEGTTPISKDEFEELPVKLMTEAMPAIKVIATQLGMEVPKEGEGVAGA